MNDTGTSCHAAHPARAAQAFSLLNLVIERCSETLRPHALELAAAMPDMWGRAEGQSLLRIQVGLRWKRGGGCLDGTEQARDTVVFEDA